jgi:hypothetical protein
MQMFKPHTFRVRARLTLNQPIRVGVCLLVSLSSSANFKTKQPTYLESLMNFDVHGMPMEDTENYKIFTSGGARSQ